jgi:hypothetical protein
MAFITTYLYYLQGVLFITWLTIISRIIGFSTERLVEVTIHLLLVKIVTRLAFVD